MLRSASKIVFVGIGGCGGNIVNSFVTSKQIDCHSINIDTDSLALKSSTAAEKFLLTENGATLACGLRGNIELGIRTALNFREKFLRRVDGHDTIVFCAGLGGGTGSGITSIFAEAVTDMGMDVLCLLTLPFDFEGIERRSKANIILKQLKSYGVQVEVFDNQTLFVHVSKGASFSAAYEVVNKHFLALLHGAAAHHFKCVGI